MDEDVIRIPEMMAKIKPEDIIVSDMYLSEQRLRELSGLKNRMFLSNQGKLDGTIWPKVQAEYSVIDHTGDNPYSDVYSPQQYGIPSILCVVGEFTDEEMALSLVFPNLAKAMREARLSTWHEDPMMRQRQLSQIEANFPLLFLASLLLDRKMEDERVLMCSRDCYLWMMVQVFVGDMLKSKYKVEYFNISRLCQLNPYPKYVNYVNQRLDNAVIVDIGGTGRSTTELLKSTIRPDTPIIFLYHYVGFVSPHISSLMDHVDNADLERVNTAPYSMIGPGGQGTFNPCHIPWDNLSETQVQYEAFEDTMWAMSKYPLDKPSDEQLKEGIHQCCQALKKYDACQEYANAYRLAEEPEVKKLLDK